MHNLLNILAVGLGGALGSMLRYGLTLIWALAGWSGTFSTLCANVVGSFAIGVLSGRLSEGTLMLLLTVGLCGGFTTFSTFSLQTVKFFQEGRIGAGVLYVAASVIACILFAALGWWISGHRAS